MPEEFWAEVVSCVVCLSNIRSPTSDVKDQILQEARNGRKPSVNHLQVFGSIYIYMYIYVHVRQQERSKLDDPSIKHVFIGYDSHSKCYKLYNPHNGKVVVSRDVEFDEKTTWTWETQLRRNNL